MIGPTLRTITQQVCEGCEHHVQVKITESQSSHRCTHDVAKKKCFTGTPSGVYIGMSDLTPVWCPELREDAK